MRTIYRTNMRTSYMAGRHAQLVDGNYRWWVYRHSGAAHPRLDHLSWDGIALPPDHPFWALHFPPNGWGCGCDVEGARTEAGIRRMGGDPGKTLPPGWDSADPRTGLPPGIGKGWAGSPADEEARLIRTMARKAVDWRYNSAVGFMREVPDAVRDDLARSYRSLPSTADAVRRLFDRVVRRENAEAANTRMTLGLATRAHVAEIGRLTGIDVSGFDFAVEGAEVLHILREHGNEAVEALRGQSAVTAQAFAILPRLIEQGNFMSAETTRQGGQPGVRVTYREGGQTFTAIFELRRRRLRLSLITMWVGRG